MNQTGEKKADHSRTLMIAGLAIWGIAILINLAMQEPNAAVQLLGLAGFVLGVVGLVKSRAARRVRR